MFLFQNIRSIVLVYVHLFFNIIPRLISDFNSSWFGATSHDCGFAVQDDKRGFWLSLRKIKNIRHQNGKNAYIGQYLDCKLIEEIKTNIQP